MHCHWQIFEEVPDVRWQVGRQNEVPGPAQQHFFGQHKESRNYRVFRRSGVCEYEEVNKAELSAYVE